MFDVKGATSIKLPIRLTDSAYGLGLAGVLYSDVTVRLVYNDGTESEFTPLIGEWQEISAGIAAGSGTYRLTITVDNRPGPLLYIVKSSGSRHFVGSIKVTTYENDEIYVRMRQLQEGRWKIHTTGPDANRLVLYAADGVTAIQKWDLKDSAGAATAGVNVFERVPTDPIPS